MGTIVKRKRTDDTVAYLAKVSLYRGGLTHRENKTFSDEAEAAAWINEREAVVTDHLSKGDGWTLAVSKANISALPRFDPLTSQVGVYFLRVAEDIVYVGQSRQVHTRVQEHRSKGRRFDTYSFISCPLDALDALERHYIKLLRPPWNITLARRRSELITIR